MESYADALQLTVIALGALLLVSFCFLGITRGLQLLIEVSARRGGAAHREGIKQDGKDKKDVVIAAAVAGYLQAERERKR